MRMKFPAKFRRRNKKPKSHTPRTVVCGILVVALCGVFVLRLADWQLLNGASFLQQADESTNITVTMPTNRGEIVDRNGVGLATNKTGYALEFARAYTDMDTLNATILRLTEIVEAQGEQWLDTLPIQLDAAGNYVFVEGRDDDIAYLKSEDFLKVNTYTDAATCMENLIDRYFETDGENGDESAQYTKEQLRKIVSVRYAMTLAGFDYRTSAVYTFAEDVSQDTVAIVSENSHALPGVTARVTTMRQYENPTLLPHIIGTMGAINAEEYAALQDQGYTQNDEIGKTGIEAALESTLRGSEGEKRLDIDSDGDVTGETVTKEPENGDTVFLTIDSKLQQAAADALAEQVQAAQRQYSECEGGAVVVLDTRDFSVLAAASYPTYDLSRYGSDSDYTSALLTDEDSPLLDRAFGSAFTPGSIFKPAVALAALQEGVITRNTTFTCNHVYMRFANSGYTPRCTGNHGTISVETALARSCNIFFFETGFYTTIAKMNAYCQQLGLGEKTGVEIDEATGTLASPAEKEASTGGVWTPVDTIQAAIGQHDNLFTPAQLAAYTATIANEGTRKQVHLVDHVTDYSRSETLSTTDPAVIVDNSDYSFLSAENLDTVQAGMRAVCTTGTARANFSDYPVAIAAKTGTAETGSASSENTTFIAYGPYENPEIAVAVVIDHGVQGTYSQGVAKAIFDAYFGLDAGSSSASSTARNG